MLRLSLLSALLSAASVLQAQTSVTTSRISNMMRSHVIPNAAGCAVGVSTPTDTVAYGFGLADLEHEVPISSNTIFEAGSVSKQVTAAAIVLLALDGKLSLEDDVRKYVPELPDYGSTIRLRHLVNHTSGLRDWGAISSLAGWPRGTRVYNNRMVVDIASKQRELNYLPGMHYSYTNTGYNLLAVIVARVSGKSFSDFTRERIFTPLGMVNSSWRDDYTRIVKGRANAYSQVNGEWHLDMPFENAHGNGAMLTTVADLIRFTRNLETGEVGGAAFVSEMHKQARLLSGRTIPYAGGLFVANWKGLREVNHSGATAGYRAFLTRIPDRKIAVAVLCNSPRHNPTTIARQLLDSFANPPAVASSVTRSVDSLTVSRLLGRYSNMRAGQATQLVWRSGRIVVGNGPPMSPDGNGNYVAANGDTFVPDKTAESNRRLGFYVLNANDSVRFEPVDVMRPDTQRYADYAGTYNSDEVEGVITVVVEGASLRIRDRYGIVRPTVSLYRDAFAAGGTVLQFVRDNEGRVTALNARADRAWKVRFNKQQ